MGLKNIASGTASVGKLASELDKADPAEAGKYLQALTGNVSGLVTTVINGIGEYKADPSLPAFDPGFSRESYGKAAVSDSVVTEADKKAYLLDDRQTEIGQSLAVISALEYQNGHRVVKDTITDTEFSNQLSEPNLNEFNEYPEEIFVNASELNSTTKQQFIFDAVVVSEDAMNGLGNSDLALQSVTTLDIAEGEIDSTDMAQGKYLIARAGGDHTNVDKFSDVLSNQQQMQLIADSADAMTDLSSLPNVSEKTASSQTAMNVISNTELAMGYVSSSETTMIPIANSQTAMNEISSIQSARDTIRNSDTAFNIIAGSNMAIGKFVSADAGLNPSNWNDMDAVSNDQTAMDSVSTSETAMDSVSSSQVSRNSVQNNGLAFDTISAKNMPITKLIAGEGGLNPSNWVDINNIVENQTVIEQFSSNSSALDTASNSQTAVNAFETKWNSQTITSSSEVPSSSVYIAEINGAGGGGGHDNGDINGDDAQDTYFGSITAHGGDGGTANAGVDGGYNIGSSASLIEGIVGGGSIGGMNDTRGGSGGYVKAILANPTKGSISVSVASGANGPYSSDGADGNIKIWTPTWV